METTTMEQKMNALAHILTTPETNPPLYSQFYVSAQIPCFMNWDYPPLLAAKSPNSVLSPHLEWQLSMYRRRLYNWGLPATSWRSKCPYQQPAPSVLANGVKEAQWADDRRRSYVRHRMERKKVELHISPLIPTMLPNVLLLSLLLYNPFPDLDY